MCESLLLWYNRGNEGPAGEIGPELKELLDSADHSFHEHRGSRLTDCDITEEKPS